VRGANGHDPPFDLVQPSGPTAPSGRNDHVDVLGPKLSRPSLLPELGDTDINTRIRGVLAHGADMNLGSGPIPLREGIDSLRVSPL
jgi:hypothetical protein